MGIISSVNLIGSQEQLKARPSQANFRAGHNPAFKGIDKNNSTNNESDLKFKDIKDNIVIGFKEGAKELWNQIKNPKNVLMGIGMMTLGFSAFSMLGLSFAACNYLFLGLLLGASIVKIGKGIINSIQHAKKDQNDEAKKDLQNVGKGVFDFAAINAPFALASMSKVIRSTDTYIESAGLLKNSKFGKLIASNYQKGLDLISDKLSFKNVNLPKFKGLTGINEWRKNSITRPLSQTKLVRKLNEIPYIASYYQGKFDIKAVRFFDEKLKLSSFVKNTGYNDNRASSAFFMEYANEFKLAYPKIVNEVESDFNGIGKITHRAKNHWHTVDKASKKGVNSENIDKTIQDIIGTRVIVDSSRQFDDVYSVIDKIAEEGRLITIKNYHGKNDTPYLNSEWIENLQKKYNNFEICRKCKRPNGYKSVQLRVRNKETGKIYEIQIRGKEMNRIAEKEHDIIYKSKLKNTNPAEFKKLQSMYDDLYKCASDLDDGKIPPSEMVKKLEEVAKYANVKLSKLVNDLLSLSRFTPGALEVKK